MAQGRVVGSRQCVTGRSGSLGQRPGRVVVLPHGASAPGSPRGTSASSAPRRPPHARQRPPGGPGRRRGAGRSPVAGRRRRPGSVSPPPGYRVQRQGRVRSAAHRAGLPWLAVGAASRSVRPETMTTAVRSHRSATKRGSWGLCGRASKSDGRPSRGRCRRGPRGEPSRGHSPGPAPTSHPRPADLRAGRPDHPIRAAGMPSPASRGSASVQDHNSSCPSRAVRVSESGSSLATRRIITWLMVDAYPLATTRRAISRASTTSGWASVPR